MKSRQQTEAPAHLDNFDLAYDHRLQQAIEETRAAAKGEGPEPDLRDLPDYKLEYVLKMAYRSLEDFDIAEFLRQWHRLRQRYLMPKIDDPLGDMEAMLFQPEVLALLGAFWPDPLRASTGPTPGYSASRGVMLTAAGLGRSSHLDDNYQFLAGNPALQRVIAAALEEAARVVELPAPEFRLQSVDSVGRHLSRLSASLGREAMIANVELLKSLAQLDPHAQVGVNLGVDGMAFPAWCEQRGARDEAEEAVLRDLNPRAGFRAFGYRDGEKVDVDASEAEKAWRGYYLVALVDLASGRPLVWVLWDAKWNEEKALKDLLRLLFEYWPDCPVETVVADALYDQEELCKICEVNYGIHPVFRQKPSNAAADKTLTRRESELLAGFTGTGRGVCRHCGEPSKYVGANVPGRDGLAPGDDAPENEFRLRFHCPHCDKTPGLKMNTRWRALTFYAHHGHGQPKRFAKRLALLGRRNACESLFSALKTGKKLGTVGADRSRLRDFETNRALVDLSFCLGTSLMLAEQRIKRGLWQPPGWAAALREQRNVA